VKNNEAQNKKGKKKVLSGVKGQRKKKTKGVTKNRLGGGPKKTGKGKKKAKRGGFSIRACDYEQMIWGQNSQLEFLFVIGKRFWPENTEGKNDLNGEVGGMDKTFVGEEKKKNTAGESFQLDSVSWSVLGVAKRESSSGEKLQWTHL